MPDRLRLIEGGHKDEAPDPNQEPEWTTGKGVALLIAIIFVVMVITQSSSAPSAPPILREVGERIVRFVDLPTFRPTFHDPTAP